MAEVKYEVTGTYNPKAPKNVQTYKEIQAVLPATLAEVKAAIPQHHDFVGYLIRRCGLAEVGSPRPAPKARKAKAGPKPKPQINLKGKQSTAE